MIGDDRIVVTVKDGAFTVSLRPDWRGMNAHTLGVWPLPMSEDTARRLADYDVDPETVADRLKAYTDCPICGWEHEPQCPTSRRAVEAQNAREGR